MLISLPILYVRDIENQRSNSLMVTLHKWVNQNSNPELWPQNPHEGTEVSNMRFCVPPHHALNPGVLGGLRSFVALKITGLKLSDDLLLWRGHRP